MRLFQVCPSLNRRFRRSPTFSRNTALPPEKFLSLNTCTRGPPNVWIEEMLSPKFPGKRDRRSPARTQNRFPLNCWRVKKNAPRRGEGLLFQEEFQLFGPLWSYIHASFGGGGPGRCATAIPLTSNRTMQTIFMCSPI